MNNLVLGIGCGPKMTKSTPSTTDVGSDKSIRSQIRLLQIGTNNTPEGLHSQKCRCLASDADMFIFSTLEMQIDVPILFLNEIFTFLCKY